MKLVHSTFLLVLLLASCDPGLALPPLDGGGESRVLVDEGKDPQVRFVPPLGNDSEDLYLWMEPSADREGPFTVGVLHSNGQRLDGELRPHQPGPTARYWHRIVKGDRIEGIVLSKGQSGLIARWGVKAAPLFRIGTEITDLPLGSSWMPGEDVAPLVPGRGNLRLQFGPGVAGTVLDVSLENGTGRYRWSVQQGPGGRILTLPEEAGSPWLKLQAGGATSEILYGYQAAPKFPEPLSADLSAMLAWSPRYWRNKNFEVFRWTINQDVLVLAFPDYATQSRWFGRLAFFLEKQGYRGTILGEDEIRGLHDWNAHNYSAEGLSAFFAEAAATGTGLRPEEARLAELALAWGILQKSDIGIGPAKGGILSFAFDPRSSQATRQLLLGHEALHGLFYGLPALRSASERVLGSLSDNSRDFLFDYFRYHSYDTDDKGLMTNEFQAYLLQQEEKALVSALGGVWLQRLEGRFPEKRTWYREVLPSVQEELAMARRALEEVVFEAVGLRPPSLVELNFLGKESLP